MDAHFGVLLPTVAAPPADFRSPFPPPSYAFCKYIVPVFLDGLHSSRCQRIPRCERQAGGDAADGPRAGGSDVDWKGSLQCLLARAASSGRSTRQTLHYTVPPGVRSSHLGPDFGGLPYTRPYAKGVTQLSMGGGLGGRPSLALPALSVL